MNFKSRGILNLETALTKFQLVRHHPAPDIGAFVEHYWLLRWDLTHQPPHTQENLPYPCVHLTLEQEITPTAQWQVAHIVGVPTGKFTRCLSGVGQVFGVKFKPGGFYPFLQSSVAALTNQTKPLSDFYAHNQLDTAIFALADDAERIALMETFLRDHLPPPDPHVDLITGIVDDIITNREIIKVDDVVARHHLNKRSLQRLFSQYVGVSPKWVIQRFRLHEAVERMEAGEAHDWPKLALELGYFDQAHFIKDFKSLIGIPPAEYAKRCTAPAPRPNAP